MPSLIDDKAQHVLLAFEEKEYFIYVNFLDYGRLSFIWMIHTNSLLNLIILCASV